MLKRNRLFAGLVSLALLAAAGLGLRSLASPSASDRYDAIRDGMTLAEVRAAVGAEGAADSPGDTTGRYLFARSERFAEPKASVTSTHHWLFPGGMVVVEFSDGRATHKTYLRGK